MKICNIIKKQIINHTFKLLNPEVKAVSLQLAWTRPTVLQRLSNAALISFKYSLCVPWSWESPLHPGEGVWCLKPIQGHLRTCGKSHWKGTERERVGQEESLSSRKCGGTNDFHDSRDILNFSSPISFSWYFATAGTVIHNSVALTYTLVQWLAHGAAAQTSFWLTPALHNLLSHVGELHNDLFLSLVGLIFRSFL